MTSAAPARPATLEVVAELARQELDWSERDAPAGPLEPGMRLVEDLQLDSIGLLTLATAVEDHFRICLDEDDEASIATVGDLVATIERKVAAGEEVP